MATRWRLAELSLLLFPVAVLALGTLLLALATQTAPERARWGPAVAFAAALLFVHLVQT